jgi:hypothetical protein
MVDNSWNGVQLLPQSISLPPALLLQSISLPSVFASGGINVPEFVSASSQLHWNSFLLEPHATFGVVLMAPPDLLR